MSACHFRKYNFRLISSNYTLYTGTCSQVVKPIQNIEPTHLESVERMDVMDSSSSPKRANIIAYKNRSYKHLNLQLHEMPSNSHDPTLKLQCQYCCSKPCRGWIEMTVEHAHTVGNGVPATDDAAAIVEYLDEEHGGYKSTAPVDVAAAAPASSTFVDKLSRLLVLHDFQNAEVWRAAAFEGVASFAATFVGILSTISTLQSSFSHPVVAIAIFQGLILSLCILAAAPATGGHVNPCITWTETLTGHISPVRGALYILSQILGSIVASILAKTAVGETLASEYSLAGCYLRTGGVGIEPGRAFVLETVLVFFVLFISYSVALDPPRLPKTGYVLAPFIVGGIVGLCIFAGGNLVAGYGGAGINPGRCIGPAVVMGGSMWDGHWVFWAGPAVAGVFMATLYRNIPPTHVHVCKQLREAKAAANKSTD